jgi:hypothetical protein
MGYGVGCYNQMIERKRWIGFLEIHMLKSRQLKVGQEYQIASGRMLSGAR